MADRLRAVLWIGPLVVVACGSPTADPGPDTPSLSPIADQSTPAGVTLDVPISLDDRGQAVSLSADATNDVLVPDDGLAFSGSGSQHNLTITPTPGLSGLTAVTVTATSTAGAASASFQLSVVREPSSGEPFTWAQRLAPPAGDSVDGFGSSVDASDDLIAVGTQDRPELSGTYVYRNSAAGGAWQPIIRIAEPDALFQMTPALDTYTLAVSDGLRTTVYARATVSAESWPVSGLLQNMEVRDLTHDRLVAEDNFGGAASVFRLSGDVWSLEDALDPGSLDANSEFASAAAIDGDVAVVGAPRQGAGGTAYVFRRSGTRWVLEAELVADDGGNGDWFGGAVAVDEERIIIGAPDADAAGTRSGAAYVFERGESWLQVAKLFEGDENDRFGTAVAAHGGELLVGAPGAVDASGLGVAYHYVGAGATWSRRLLVAPGTRGEDGVGWSAAFDVDVVVLGAPGDAQRPLGSGAAHVFVR